jgi:glycosyltransferase involved in cell wall biosynthesis
MSAASTRPILFVVDQLLSRTAGTEKQLMELIKGLTGTSFEPHLAILRETGSLSASDAFLCPVHNLKLPRLIALDAVPRLLGLSRLARRLGARVVHVCFNDASIAAPPFCRLGGARVVSARRDMGFWYTKANLAALKVGNAFVDLIVANSRAVRENVHEREGFPLDRIAVVPNGHDLERFDRPASDAFRGRLGLGPEARVIGMVANLNAWKRHADLVAALPRIRTAHPDVHLVLVGRGDELSNLRQQADRLDQRSHVHFLEDVHDAAPVIKHFDVAVLCSDSEGLSNAIIEYALCGRPIVCTDVGGNAEVVDDDCGIRVPKADPEALATAIGGLLSDPARADELGKRARSRAAARFARESMVAAYCDIYDKLQNASWPGPRS